MARAWRRLPDIRGPFACGGAASLSIRPQVIFETTADHMAMIYGRADDTGPAPRVWIVDQIDFFNHAIWLRDAAGATTKLDLPTGIWMQAHGDWFAMKLRKDWTVEGRTYATDTVLGISLSAFLAGHRDFTVLFEPGAAARLARPVLGGGQAGAVDPRRAAAALRDLHAIRRRLEPRDASRPPADRRRRHLAARSPSVREQWRPARQCAGPADAAVAAADRARRRKPDRAEAGAEDVHRRRPRGDTARGDLDRRRAHSLCADRPRQRDRRCAGLYERLWRLRPCGEAVLQPLARQAVAGARRHHRAGEFARRRRVRHPLARCRPARRQETLARRFRGRCRRSRAPRRDASQSGSRRKADRTAASSSPTCWCATPSASARCSAPSR